MRRLALLAVLGCSGMKAAPIVDAAPADAPPPPPDAGPTTELAIVLPGEGEAHSESAAVTVKDRRDRSVAVMPSDGRWLDFIVRTVPPAPARATVGGVDVPLDAHGRGRIDLVQLCLDADAEQVLGSLARPSFTVEIRAGDATGRLEIQIPAYPLPSLVAELENVAKKPLAWATPVSPGGRPVIRVHTEKGESTGVTVGGLIPGPERVRDVQLVALDRWSERKIGSCRCKHADFGNPYYDPDEIDRCDRTRYEEDITIVEATTGKEVARHHFAGEPSPPCRGIMDSMDMIPKVPGKEVETWIVEISGN